MASRKKECCRPFSRGTLLVLVWSGLLYASQWFAYNSLCLALPNELKSGFEYAHVALWLLLPVTGWVADAWLGRYHAIIVGFILSVVTMLTCQAAFIMLEFKWTPILVSTLLYVALLIGTVAFGSFYTSLLPFTLDQMIGASAEELSAAVQWHWWGLNMGMLAYESLQCIFIPNTTQLDDFLPMIYITPFFKSIFYFSSDIRLPVSQVA